MLARRHDHAALRARFDVDVGIDAALTDQPELVESMQQRRADLGPLAYQHQRFGIPQSSGQRIDVLHMVVPDPDLVSRQLPEAVERAQRVVIVVKNGDLHLSWPPQPRRAASIAAMSIFLISIIASNARLAAARSGSVIACVRAIGVICQDRPHLSLHQPQALSWPPLPTIAFQ